MEACQLIILDILSKITARVSQNSQEPGEEKNTKLTNLILKYQEQIFN